MRPSRTAALFFVLGIGLVPWTLLLADKLPSRKIAHHWDLAWVGLDVALAVTLAVLVEIPLAVLCFVLAHPEPTG